MSFLRQSTASQTRTIGPFIDSGDFTSLENGLTIANTDILLKKNGGASAAKNSGGATADGSGGKYAVTFDATDTDTVGELDVTVTVSGALTYFTKFTVLEEAVYDAMFAASATGVPAAGATAAAQTTAQNDLDILTGSDGATLATTQANYAPAKAGDEMDLVDAPNATAITAIQSGLATPTNITAGTITTVTNLTNAPTAGDLTATMKASVNTEVDSAIETYHLDHLLAATYDPASKPGAADALLNELVENDGGVSRFSANALEEAPGGSAPTVGEIADAVWTEAIADHSGTSGSTAEALNAAGSAGDPWVTALPGAYGAGSAGFILGTNLNATVSSRASQTSVDDVPTVAEFEARTLTAASYATATNQTTIITHLTDVKGATFDGGTDSLEAIRNRGDSAWITATGFSTLDAAGVRTAVGLSSANLDTQLGDIPTVSEFNARTLAAADYFDPAADTVANVTTVGSVTTKTGYSLASTGLDLVVPADPSAIPVLGTSSIVAWIGYFGLWSTAEVNSTSSAVTLRNSADSADIATHGTSDDGSVFSSGEAS